MDKTLVDRATLAGIISPDQAQQLLSLMAINSGAPIQQTGDGWTLPKFDLIHVLWYFGALTIIGSMGLFSTLAFTKIEAGKLLATALVYGLLFMLAGNYLWSKHKLYTPAGLLIAVAVSMTPLAVFAFQNWVGLWSLDWQPENYRSFYQRVSGGYLPMEIATITVALWALRFYRFPFLIFLVAVAAWFMSMDIADLIIRITTNFDGKINSDYYWDLRNNTSLIFGLCLIAIAWTVDLHWSGRKDFGFWLHLVGAVTFWGGLTFQNSDSEIGKFIYFLINIGLIGFSIYIRRRVYAVFGALGCITYLYYLSDSFFKDSLLFPFVLSGVGFLIISAGVWLYSHGAGLILWFDRHLPARLIRLRPQPQAQS